VTYNGKEKKEGCKEKEKKITLLKTILFCFLFNKILLDRP